MKVFDRATMRTSPPFSDEWAFAFVSAYRNLRPDISEKYAKAHAVTACGTLKDVAPAKAAEMWLKTRGPRT